MTAVKSVAGLAYGKKIKRQEKLDHYDAKYN